MDYKYWNNKFKTRGLKYFFLDIKAKFVEKSIKNKFAGKALTDEQKELINHYFYYSYLKKKYKKWIQQQNPDLSFHTPNNTKIVWWCWFQGEENAPLICKQCLASIRKYLPDYEIKVITDENMFSYINVPSYIEKKYKEGLITKTHFSDILRTCLLAEYGGVWIDSTVLLTDKINDLIQTPLFYFKNYDRGNSAIIASSWFLSAAKAHPIINILKEFLFLYWKNNNYLIHYYLFHLLLTLINETFPTYNDNIPTFSNIPTHILQREQYELYNPKRFEQIEKISRVHKLNRRVDISTDAIKGTNLEYILNIKY